MKIFSVCNFDYQRKKTFEDVPNRIKYQVKQVLIDLDFADLEQ